MASTMSYFSASSFETVYSPQVKECVSSEILVPYKHSSCEKATLNFAYMNKRPSTEVYNMMGLGIFLQD
jgi:hypothetical protein